MGSSPIPTGFSMGRRAISTSQGNPTPRDQSPRVGGLGGQPFVQGILWLAVLSGLAMSLRKERRMRPLLMYTFYLFCAIAFMAKGLLGLAIPGAAALFYLIASRRWTLLTSGELRVATGVLIVTAVSMPWYLAMYVRHGPSFTNRLLIHDHINRLASGVHGDTGTVEYFLAQAGYADIPVDRSDPCRSHGRFLDSCEIRSRSARRGRAVLVELAVVVVRAFQRDGDQVPPLHSSCDHPGGHPDRDCTLPLVGSEAPSGDAARGGCGPVRNRRLCLAYR